MSFFSTAESFGVLAEIGSGVGKAKPWVPKQIATLAKRSKTVVEPPLHENAVGCQKRRLGWLEKEATTEPTGFSHVDLVTESEKQNNICKFTWNQKKGDPFFGVPVFGGYFFWGPPLTETTLCPIRYPRGPDVVVGGFSATAAGADAARGLPRDAAARPFVRAPRLGRQGRGMGLGGEGFCSFCF